MCARPAFLPGEFYHFFNRGAHRLSIFRVAENYVFVLKKVKHYCRTLGLTPVAYCLLPNHYHFLLRQDGEQSAGRLVQYVFNSYSKAYNKRYGHSGTLFEGNYRVRHVRQQAHLLHLCRYVHANPVKHGIVSRVQDWPYSNYLEWIQERDGSLLDREFVETYFETPASYVRFVQEYVAGGFCREG